MLICRNIEETSTRNIHKKNSKLSINERDQSELFLQHILIMIIINQILFEEHLIYTLNYSFIHSLNVLFIEYF